MWVDGKKADNTELSIYKAEMCIYKLKITQRSEINSYDIQSYVNNREH